MKTRMKYPVTSYSWTLLSENKAVKHLDKSAFLHHGTAIPKEIATFFNLPEQGIKEPQLISLQKDDRNYEGRIQLDQLLSRYRLFWKADFVNLLNKRFPEVQKIFAANKELNGNGPEMRFERITPDIYRIDVIDPISMPLERDPDSSEWTDYENDLAPDPDSGMVNLRDKLPPVWQEIAKGGIYRKLVKTYLCIYF